MSGACFRRREALNAHDYLDAALEAEKYVRSFLRETDDGIAFGSEPSLANVALYGGAAGVAVMYGQLWRVTGEGRYRERALGIVAYLKAHCLDFTAEEWVAHVRFPGITKSLYSGLAGVGMAFAALYREFGDDAALAGLEEVLKYYSDQQVRGADGVYWTDNAPVYFDAGVLLFLVDAYELLVGTGAALGSSDDRAPAVGPAGGDAARWTWLRTMVRESACYLVSCGEEHDGAFSIDHVQLDFKRGEPNFEFGTAGVGYVLARVHEFTRDKAMETVAREAAEHLRRIAVSVGDGALVPYKPAVYGDLFYLGNCHGPVGTAKLFYELFEQTGEHAYLDEARRLFHGARAMGAPYRQSAGFWNTLCWCCGPTGYIPWMIGMEKATGEAGYADVAKGVGDILLGEMCQVDAAGHRAWRFAFDRTAPEELSAAAGLYNGAAGNAVQLARLYAHLTDGSSMRPLPDDPYGA